MSSPLKDVFAGYAQTQARLKARGYSFTRKLSYAEQEALPDAERDAYYEWLLDGPPAAVHDRKYARMLARDQGRAVFFDDETVPLDENGIEAPGTGPMRRYEWGE